MSDTAAAAGVVPATADPNPKGPEAAAAQAAEDAKAKKAKKKVSISTAWREAGELIHANRSRLMLGFGVMLVSRAASLVVPGSTKMLMDDVLGKGQSDLLVPIALAMLGATIIQAGTGFWLAHLLGLAAQRAINDMRKTVQAHITRLPLNYYDATQTGQLISRIMHDAEGIRNLVGNGLVQLFGGLLTAVAALCVMLWLNTSLTLMILCVLAFFGVSMAYTFKRLRPLFRERGQISAEVTGRLNQSLGGIRVIKAYSAEPREQSVFAAGVDRIYDNIRRSIVGVHGISAIGALVMGICGALIAWQGGQAAIDGTMTLGSLIMFIFFTGMLASPVIGIASIGTQISEAFAGLDRIREVRQLATEDDGDEDRESCTDLKGDVSFDHVTFSYVPGRPVLKDIHFDAPAGSTVALVGPSGSGKSTLVGLVMAFNRPDSGRLLVDGRDLSNLKLTEWRRNLGIVLQDNFLFDGTIAENISFAKPEATREELVESARLARVDDFVKDFADGYDTVVGERGVKLSGGQRQRVAIARALLANPSLLILDEATSSLDSESEAHIQEGLERLRSGRTTFVIAHRLSTIRAADLILVLDDGEVVESGSYDELLAGNGRFRQLHDTQYRFERERFVNPGEEFVGGVDATRKTRTLPSS